MARPKAGAVERKAARRVASPDPIASFKGVGKSYRLGEEEVRALEDVSFEIDPGSFVAVTGPSGSGKSTLLHLLGGLDRPTSGAIEVEGRDLSGLTDEELTAFRRRRLGFVFQFFNLLPTMRAWENVALPRLLEGENMSSLKPEALELLALVGLEGRAEHRPGQLSGGEMQRVAIARALVADPVLILCDEPTGNLDSRAGDAVLDLLALAVVERGKTVVMVTHERGAATRANRILQLADGRLT